MEGVPGNSEVADAPNELYVGEVLQGRGPQRLNVSADETRPALIPDDCDSVLAALSVPHEDDVIEERLHEGVQGDAGAVEGRECNFSKRQRSVKNRTSRRTGGVHRADHGVPLIATRRYSSVFRDKT